MTGQLPIPTARTANATFTETTTELADRIHALCLLWLNRAEHQTMGSASYRQGAADALHTAAAELAGELAPARGGTAELAAAEARLERAARGKP